MRGATIINYVFKKTIKKKVILTFFFTLSITKLWLVSGQTPFVIGDSYYDDRLFLNLANAILRGEWLGEYNNLTLVKGVFYPLFIALAFLLNVPLLLFQHLFYIGACVVFVFAIKPLINRTALLMLIYTVLLFNPISYSDGSMTRFLREGIYPALTMLVVATSIGILVRNSSKTRNLTVWSFGLGFSLSAFWLTREEGIWIIPLIIIVIGAASIITWRTRRVDWRKKLYLYTLPFIIWMISIMAIAGINKFQYGVFTTTEFKSSEFKEAYGALSRVKHEKWNPYIPVPKEVRLKIYQVSPAFSELRPFLEGDLGKGWSSAGRIKDDEEIEGGWFVWAFRDAVARAGYYSSAESARKYYYRLAVEINQACANKKLDCGPERASLSSPWNDRYTKPLLNSIVRGSIYLIKFKDFNARSSSSYGSEEDRLFFRNITNEDIPESRNILFLKGWLFSPDSDVSLSVRTNDGNLADAAIKLLASPDVYDYFLASGKDIANAREARFDIRTSCDNDCYLYVKSGSELLERIPINGSMNSFRSSKIIFYIDSIQYSNYDPVKTHLNEFKVKTLQAIGGLYQVLVPIFVFLSLILYLLILGQLFVNRSNFITWIIATSLLLSIIIRIFIISLIEISSFPAIKTTYLSPAYPLLLVFILIVIISFLKYPIKPFSFKDSRVPMRLK